MKRLLGILIIILAIIALSGTIMAADKWDKADIGLAAVSLSLQAMDWRETLYIIENPKYEELNPILGNKPSIGQVNAYFAATALLQLGIANYLPSKWRKAWLSCWIIVSGQSLYRNNAIGIGIQW